MDNRKYEIQIVIDKQGLFRWRGVARNGQCTGTSHEGYDSPSNAVRGFDAFLEGAKSADIVHVKEDGSRVHLDGVRGNE